MRRSFTFLWGTAVSQYFGIYVKWWDYTAWMRRRFHHGERFTTDAVISYQGYGVDSVEPAYSVLQLRTGEPTQKVADGANAVHDHIDVHPRLQQKEVSLSCVTPTGVSELPLDEREGFKNCVRWINTDLKSHQLCHLPVVAIEHILQTQPDRQVKG